MKDNIFLINTKEAFPESAKFSFYALKQLITDITANAFILLFTLDS